MLGESTSLGKKLTKHKFECSLPNKKVFLKKISVCVFVCV